MAEELLSLKWNNHQAHFVDILTFLREQEIFVDATLACGGKLYPAHKFVLSTCSDYFKQMFTKNPSKHPIVFMKDVSCRDLEALLDFMYNGEVNVPQSSLGSLIKTAEGLQIKGLAVPDDPPTKRERKDTKSSHDSHHSPPPKRRARDRSPPLPLGATHSSSSHTTSTPTASKSRSPPPPPTIAASSSSSSSHSSQSVMPPVEATLDEDSRTSVHSGQSEQNTSVTTPSLGSKPQPPPPPVSNQLSSSSQENQQIQHDASQSSQGSEEPSPGPSGLHRSKEEVELDIKQEDFVEIGDEDEGDWGVEGEGGGDSSMGSENPPNFPEVMLPTDGSVPPAGDPAMVTPFLLLLERGRPGPPAKATPPAQRQHDGEGGSEGEEAKEGEAEEELEERYPARVKVELEEGEEEEEGDPGWRRDWTMDDLEEEEEEKGVAGGLVRDGGAAGVGGEHAGGGVGGAGGLYGQAPPHHLSQFLSHRTFAAMGGGGGGGGGGGRGYGSLPGGVGRMGGVSNLAMGGGIIGVPRLGPRAGMGGGGAATGGGGGGGGGGGEGGLGLAALGRAGRRSNNPMHCPVCGRVLLFRSEYEKHMRTHTGEKPFQCHLCPYRSAQRSNLNVHLKSVHKTYPPGAPPPGVSPGGAHLPPSSAAPPPPPPLPPPPPPTVLGSSVASPPGGGMSPTSSSSSTTASQHQAN
ncbi:uncharacterized protein LOC143031107 isoform X1 [Oratosquilla oratoria]|uniref:uncharacterized protein LOC143031107 isoform X1 n=1 Tax=Oratosquilla oratoria TaxID=337810 RepID=UPI003F7742A8